MYVKYIDTYHSIEFTKENFIRFKELEIPPFSSIERAGRSIRNKYKYLDELEQEKRQFAEEQYREYARRRKNWIL